ncbi:MAG: septum formation initiator family protein [Verrucomicrobiaceae bacterium]|jgi:cell division protein FtsB|nr:septum formation initiator family protein [Verrucomicrobiaceae bacterium]
MKLRVTRADLPQGNLEHWARVLLRVAKFILLLLMAPAILVLFHNPLDEQNAMREKLEQLKHQRDSLKQERDKWLRRKDWLEKDDAYLELQARDRLNRQKAGEYVLRF